MDGISRVESLGTEKIGKLLLEMSSQTTLSLLVYAIYSLTDIYFLSVGINSLAAAGASIISPVLIALGAVANTVGAGGASVVSRALGEQNVEKASRTVANTFLIFWTAAITITVLGSVFIEPIVYLLEATGVAMVTAAAFQSVGRAKEALLLTLGGILLVKLPVLLLASRLFSLTGIWTSEAISELILCIVSFIVLKNARAGSGIGMVRAPDAG